MILSDKEIKESHAPYAIFRVSHLLANARIRELEAKIKEHEQDGYRVSFELGKALRDKIAAAIDEMIAREDRADRLAVIADALAAEVNITWEFAGSTHKIVAAHKMEAEAYKAKLRELREVIERNQKDLPAEFSRLVDDHFWELV